MVPADPVLGTPEQELLVLRPEQARRGAILFVHGGGFAFCDARTHERCARGLAVASGLPVILPNYRLAPEHPFPAGLHDVVATQRQAFAASGLPEGALCRRPHASQPRSQAFLMHIIWNTQDENI
ncbi:alpha/beta hydrolase [Roseomonas gilardii]|uniref:alpha/beta hydrolase n=1 Tax=Roseomonas gilardii TaxID=257708 RepID=UPI00048010C2|nr:alpha/beta hydrolase fold domain-containing protein [Roseomonas gilardii]